MRKIKRLIRVGSAFVLSVSALLTIGFVGTASALAPYTCTWTGATNDNFSTAGNWTGCNSAAPQPGDDDNLVFNNSSLGAAASLNNDITGLNLGNITFSGTSTYGFTISGNPITLGGGITQSSSAASTSYLTVNITLNAAQDFTNSSSSGAIIYVGSPSTTVNLGTNQLTLNDTGSSVYVDGAFVGSGTLVNIGNNVLYTASPSFTGPFEINSGDFLTEDPGAFGSGNVTIASGAVLDIVDSAASATLSNNITVSGSGAGNGAIISCLEVSGVCTTSATNLTLSGDITLGANTEVSNGAYTGSGGGTPANNATFTFTGAVNYNGFTLTAVPNSNTTVILPVVTTTTTTPAKKAPAAPDTGSSLTKTDVALPLIGSILVASGLVVASKKNFKLSNIKLR